jgi:succinate dehydrogenase / fumarate reductase flavoprotein subunit
VEIPNYLNSLDKSHQDVESSVFEGHLQHEQAFKDELMARDGDENVHQLHEELSDWMVKHVTVQRSNPELAKTMDKIKEIRERYKNIRLGDRSQYANQTYAFANQFEYMLDLAQVITKGALLRDEFRGAHFKPEFPERDDKNWLKSTLATFDPSKDEPVISYEEVDTRHLEPIMRDYTQAKKVKPTLKNIPSNIKLPL